MIKEKISPNVENYRRREKLFSLGNLEQQNTSFQDDRPWMKFVNQADVRIVTNSLIEEIGELNGKGKEGHFAKDENREDYRQQELADIVLFAITTLRTINTSVDEEVVWAKADDLARQLGIVPVSADKPLGEVRLFDGGIKDGVQSRTYDYLKNLINLQKNVLDKTVDVGDEELIKEMVQNVMATAFAIYYLIGLHPVRASLEKVARNQLKYQAKDFSLEAMAEYGLTVESDLDEVMKAFGEQIAKSSLAWDGPRDVVTGEKPGLNTEKFYNLYQQEKVDKVIYEEGWINSSIEEDESVVDSVYSLIARAISWWYGRINE